MKRLIGIALGIALLALALCGGAIWAATQIPAPPAPDSDADTGREEGDTSGLVDALAGVLGLDAGAARTSYRLLQEVVENGEAEITAPELADIVTTALSGSPDGRAFLAAAEPPRVRYDADRVEIGSVVDLSELNEGALSADTRDAVERFRRYAPVLADRPLWIAIDSAPFAHEGDIDLGSNASFRIGRLPLPGFLARPLGLDARLREALLLDLRLLSVQEVAVRDDHLYLRATPSPGAP